MLLNYRKHSHKLYEQIHDREPVIHVNQTYYPQDTTFLDIFTFQTPIIFDNSPLQAEVDIYPTYENKINTILPMPEILPIPIRI